MIWFDIKQLEKGFINGNLTDKEGFNYLLANMVLFSLTPYLVGDRSENNWLLSIQFVVDIFITIMSVITTYRINTTGNDKDYLKRFLGLSFVITIRLFVYILIVLLPAGLIMHYVNKSGATDKNTNDIFWFFVQIFIIIIYYFLLTNSFRRVNERKQ